MAPRVGNTAQKQCRCLQLPPFAAEKCVSCRIMPAGFPTLMAPNLVKAINGIVHNYLYDVHHPNKLVGCMSGLIVLDSVHKTD